MVFGRDRATKLEKGIKDNYERIIRIQSKQTDAVLDVLERLLKTDNRLTELLPSDVQPMGKEDWVDSVSGILDKVDSGMLDELVGDDVEGKALKMGIKTIKKPLISFLQKRKDILNPIISGKLEGLAMKMIQKRETEPKEIER